MDTILVDKSWKFLEESTDEELNLLISVVSQCCKIDIDKLNHANIISRILQLRNQDENSSFETFLNDIGEEVGCDPKITWVLYPYMLLVSLLRDSLINCTSEMIGLISKEFDLPSTSVSSISKVLRSRIASNEDFRKNFPFILASILGIKWRESIHVLPLLSSEFISRGSFYSKESVMLASVLGPLAQPVTGISRVLTGWFSSKSSGEELFPVVVLLILLNQEHNSKFENSKDVVNYIENNLRMQDTFETTSLAAISIIQQLIQDNQNKEDSDIVESVISDKLHGKRFYIPEYRLQKILPYKDDVIQVLADWIVEDDAVIDAFAVRFTGKHPKAKNEVIVLDESQSIKQTGAIVAKIDGTSPSEEDSIESIPMLRARIAELEMQIEEANRAFSFLRHDVKTMYATSVAPLYDFINGLPLDKKTVEKALEKEAIVTGILKDAGRLDYGLRTGNKYSLKSMTESAMQSDQYSFHWKDTSVDAMIDISETCFKNRVLSNIRNNFERCAFGVPPFCDLPVIKRIVEAVIVVNEQWAVLPLSNNGMPISENDTKVIFEDGVSIGQLQSTGHGLAYVAKFMEHWNGSVEAIVPKNDFNISFVFKFKI